MDACEFIWFELQVTIYKTILRPMQAATMAVLTFPSSPDLLALCNAVAEDEGDLPAGQAMQV